MPRRTTSTRPNSRSWPRTGSLTRRASRFPGPNLDCKMSLEWAARANPVSDLFGEFEALELHPILELLFLKLGECVAREFLAQAQFDRLVARGAGILAADNQVVPEFVQVDDRRAGLLDADIETIASLVAARKIGRVERD